MDGFDAMTSNRSYNTRKTYKEVAEELEKCSGTQFDPEISAAFVEIVRKNEGESFIEGVSDT